MISGSRNRLRLHIAGRGGDGNITLGDVLGKVLARRGYHVFSFRTYPAEIEGGVSQIVLTIGTEKVHSSGSGSELALAFTADALEEIRSELCEDAYVLRDQSVRGADDLRGHAIEATKIARWTYGNPKLKNLVMLGAVGKMLGLETSELIRAARERTQKVEPELIARTIEHGVSLAPSLEEYRLAPATDVPQLILSGNQAVGLGAIRAGCNYVAGYPITPASPLLEYLARSLPAFGGTVVQTEDEMAALGSCIGASYAGAKALTPTSGPGFALMSEMINLGVMAEVPVVIVNVQRAGPSTGMPSKTEQGDLLTAMYGSPGESPRIVLAAADVEDAFVQTIRAFNLSEQLQCPVILLSDQSLAYRQETVSGCFGRDDIEIAERARMNGTPPAEFKRFLFWESGVSATGIPGGKDAPFMTTGLEHNELGQENYSPDVHRLMTEKRHRKLITAARLASPYEQDFEKLAGARVGVLGWGSTRGAILEAYDALVAEGVPLARMHLHTLRPLPEKQLRAFASEMDRLIVVEENYTGQLATIVRGIVDCEVVTVNKCEGLPFETAELIEQVGQAV